MLIKVNFEEMLSAFKGNFPIDKKTLEKTTNTM
jgi:hypothetical protein